MNALSINETIDNILGDSKISHAEALLYMLSCIDHLPEEQKKEFLDDFHYSFESFS